MSNDKRKSRRAKPEKRPPKPGKGKQHSDSSKPAGRAGRGGAAESAPRAAFSWFPPHMHRTQRKLLDEARHVDLIIEVRDARLPLGSANPELDSFAQGKPRLVLFNKASLADHATSRAWEAYFRRINQSALFVDADTPRDAKRIHELAMGLTQPMRAAFAKRGMRPPDPRVIVLGIPNVGKSTLINRLLKRKRLKTGPEPGVTRTTQWVPLRGQLLLLDTPGVLLPRIETDREALRLGWIGALPQHLFGPERMAHALVRDLGEGAPSALSAAYPGSALHSLAAEDWLAEIARRRGFLTGRGEPDITRAADQLLRDFREGKLGRHSMELPPHQQPSAGS